MQQAHNKSLLASSHDLSDGGLLVAISESVMGSNLGASINISNETLPTTSYLCSESHSRFLVSVDPAKKQEFEKIFVENHEYLGQVTTTKTLNINKHNKTLINLPAEKMLASWRQPLAHWGSLS